MVESCAMHWPWKLIYCWPEIETKEVHEGDPELIDKFSRVVSAGGSERDEAALLDRFYAWVIRLRRMIGAA